MFPELLTEWDYTKNKKKPSEYPPYSHQKVWWNCSKNQKHRWQAKIGSRTRGHECPFCTGRYPSEDYNLAVAHPNLVKEWHPTKNGELKPSDVTPGSNRKVWWICNRGHEWEAVVKSRSNGRDCSKCIPQTSRLEIRVYCELKTIFEDVKWRKKIDGLECDIYLPKNNIGVEVDGYLWHEGREEYDRIKGSKLLEKSVKVFRVRDDRLKQVSHTDIFYREGSAHLSILIRLLKNLIEYVSFTSGDRLKIDGYLESNQLQNRSEYKKINSFLPGPPPEDSLAQLYPKLAEEWNIEKNEALEPRMFSSGSKQKVWWTCSQGHEWEATINNRTNGTGCPYCSGKKAGYENTLAFKEPNLAGEWHPTRNGDLSPDQVTHGSNKKVWWNCSQGHEWEATIDSRTKGKTGCPYCLTAGGARKASAGYNLLIRFPELAGEWHPTRNGDLAPDQVTPGSHRKVWWICSQGHEWEAVINNRTRGTGCPTCWEESRQSHTFI